MVGDALLQIDDLDVTIDGEHGRRWVLQGISLTVDEGARTGLVGESGSGKTMTALATIGLLPRGGRVTAGAIHFDGDNLVGQSEQALRLMRGTQIGMTFQNAKACLDPLVRVGTQIAQVYQYHNPDIGRKDAFHRAVEILGEMGINDPNRRARSYPHEFSGGMAQRAMIALALVCSPRLLITDEPTTGLDVTVEEQVLRIIGDTVNETGSSLLFISHDLRVIAEMCTNVVVMYAGKVVEEGPTKTILSEPAHPYTQGLVAAARMSDAARMETIPGRPPEPTRRHAACPFVDRCPAAFDPCWQSVPSTRRVSTGHHAACFLVEES